VAIVYSTSGTPNTSSLLPRLAECSSPKIEIVDQSTTAILSSLQCISASEAVLYFSLSRTIPFSLVEASKKAPEDQPLPNMRIEGKLLQGEPLLMSHLPNEFPEG